MNTSMFLINRLPNSSINFDTPYEILYKCKFDYNQLRVFGCSCFPYIRQYNDNKLQPRSKLCVYLGYSPGTKGYRCYDPLSNKVYMSRHVRFIEHEFPYQFIIQNLSKYNKIQSTNQCQKMNSYYWDNDNSNEYDNNNDNSISHTQTTQNIINSNQNNATCNTDELNTHSMITRSKSNISKSDNHRNITKKHNVTSTHPMTTRSNNSKKHNVNIGIQNWDNE